MKKKVGFALMDEAKRKEIATLGGKKAHALGVAHKFTSDEGKAAAQKSIASRRRKKAHKNFGVK